MEPYIPDHLPLKSIDRLSHIKKMSHATIAIARYDGILQGMPNPQGSPLTNADTRSGDFFKNRGNTGIA